MGLSIFSEPQRKRDIDEDPTGRGEDEKQIQTEEMAEETHFGCWGHHQTVQELGWLQRCFAV